MGDIVKVYSAPSAGEAELMKGLLESGGISVELKGEGEGMFSAGPMYIWVPAAQEDEARAIVEAASSGQLDDPTE